MSEPNLHPLRKTGLTRIASAIADLRAAALAISSDLPEGDKARMAQAFDSATHALSVVVGPLNGPKFNRRRFAEACGVAFETRASSVAVPPIYPINSDRSE